MLRSIRLQTLCRSNTWFLCLDQAKSLFKWNLLRLTNQRLCFHTCWNVQQWTPWEFKIQSLDVEPPSKSKYVHLQPCKQLLLLQPCKQGFFSTSCFSRWVTILHHSAWVLWMSVLVHKQGCIVMLSTVSSQNACLVSQRAKLLHEVSCLWPLVIYE